MSLVLYGFDASPPVRACLMTIKALGIDVEYKIVDLLNGKHLTPEFLKINPLHTLPVIRDGDFSVWDSHVINAYLVDKYGKDDSLYPKDLQKRAVVNQRMYFDAGLLFPRLRAISYPIFLENVRIIDNNKAKELEDAYGSLEALLGNNTYVAGEQLSIADFSVATTVSSANVLVPIASSTFPNIIAWLERIRKLPYYGEGNQKGLDQFAGGIKSRLG